MAMALAVITMSPVTTGTVIAPVLLSYAAAVISYPPIVTVTEPRTKPPEAVSVVL